MSQPKADSESFANRDALIDKVLMTHPPTRPRSDVYRTASPSLARQFYWRRAQEAGIACVLFLCAFLSILTTVGIVYVLFAESVFDPVTLFIAEDPQQERRLIPAAKAFFQEVSPGEFFTGTQWTPQYVDKHFGVLPLLGGTLLIAVIAAVIGLPFGLLGAIYLSEYASPRMRSIIKPVLEMLAGIPTVVYGYFGLTLITPYVIQPVFTGVLGLPVGTFNALCGGIVVGIMIVPMICSLSEDALHAVPVSLREAGYALGATKYDVSARIVVPAAFSGIVASFMLAMARAVGETMAVTMCAGGKPNLTLNPLESVQTMTSYMVNVSLGDTPAGTIEYKSLYAVGLCLFCVTLVMNMISHAVMRRYREAYQ
jgi:phosphate transport system permease protein